MLGGGISCSIRTEPCVHACARAGYTPLHMAVGYSHVATVAALLEAGADPEVQDRQSRDVIALVQSIRDQMPVSPQFMGRRMALEQVTALLSGGRALLRSRMEAVQCGETGAGLPCGQSSWRRGHANSSGAAAIHAVTKGYSCLQDAGCCCMWVVAWIASAGPCMGVHLIYSNPRKHPMGTSLCREPV